MGDPDRQLAKINPLIQQIRGEIKREKYFELGDDPGPLERLESRLLKIYGLLESCSGFYAAKSIQESNPYYSAVRITRRAQEAVQTIRMKGEGTLENTTRILVLVDELERSIALLTTKNHPAASTSDDSHQKQQGFKIGLPIPPKPQVSVKHSLSIDTPALPVSALEKKPIALSILAFVFITLPRIMGRALLDIFGRGKDSADTTSIVVGYVSTIVIILVLWGILDLNSLVSWFTEWWRFFFPLK